MARKLSFDRWLFLATMLLVGCSLVMVYSASVPIAVAKKLPQSYFLTKQAMWVALGVAVLALAIRFDYRHFRKPVVIWTMVGLALAGLVIVLLGPAHKGGRRWLGIQGFGIQPSEFAKIAMVVFTSALLERRMARINEVTYSLTPVGVLLGAVVALMYMEPDLGGSVAIVMIVLAMVFAAGLAWRYLIAAALAGIPAVLLAVISEGYRHKRLLAFLDPWKDPQGSGYQLLQSIITVGVGGVFGRGVGWGMQKYYYLPEAHNDFIYAVVGEELGLIGTSAILICFAVITWRGLRIAARAPDAFSSLLATGITAMIAVQAFINMSVVLGMMPTKGIPLPLVSSGGSSLLVCMLGIGMLLNVSQHVSAEE